MSKPITAGALAKILAKHPDRVVVLRTCGPRGQPTYYAAVHATSLVAFDPKAHDVGLEQLTPNAVKLGYTEDDVPLRAKPAILLKS